MNTIDYHDNIPLWTELLPGGHHWSGRIRRGSILQFQTLASQANVSLFCVNSEDKLERFNMPDTLKAQHTAFLTTGHVLYSDLGRVMASIVRDDHGWNDVLCGPSRNEQIQKQFGIQTFQDARNQMFRSARDGLLIEMTKFSLGQTDLSATVNLFSKVCPDDAGNLTYMPTMQSHHTIELRFEMDCLLFLSAAPHGLNQATHYAPADIQMSLFKARTLAEHDICRDACSQNQRGFQNNARYYAFDTL